ncbi:Histidine phosphatase superfamily (branch 1) [Hymenobacter gelipurpurascens]|uniref:Histidine phosphatase superfamily (Branch 1) n=1 Tax=Hymenobacter gelipurpurascens TaxID=89968 RepID=A0A212TDF4_9BACT|nr:histidine phosphatase family protein [Hymenobacter gelipurpurascens]SNC63851.1 Histidine phosphatase superfamily (branch 1) [Hymenobacter gelipurpurascens]
MKKILNLLVCLLPLLGLLASCSTAKLSKTTVYVVRHAEKDTTPGLADPALTTLGQSRAVALRDQLQDKAIVAIFSTNTVRTRTTAEPLAKELQLPIQTYDAKQLPALATRIRREYAGRAVLVVGHSNTILETAEALGAPRPVPTVGDDEFNYLLEVTVPQDSAQAATAVARRYGATN